MVAPCRARRVPAPTMAMMSAGSTNPAFTMGKVQQGNLCALHGKGTYVHCMAKTCVCALPPVLTTLPTRHPTTLHSFHPHTLASCIAWQDACMPGTARAHVYMDTYIATHTLLAAPVPGFTPAWLAALRHACVAWPKACAHGRKHGHRYACMHACIAIHLSPLAWPCDCHACSNAKMQSRTRMARHGTA
eukprot:359543-Chlamydomonas_euryale.AAC.4